MTAIRFWDSAPDYIKRLLIERSEIVTNEAERLLSLPFWHLPTDLKETIYNSPEFRSTE